MHEVKIKLKSGKEFSVFCKEYKIETSKLSGELVGFEYEGAYGEVPLFLSLMDVECITEIIKKKDWEDENNYTEVLCDFKRCIYNQNGVCTKEVIDLDERVEDVFIGCPDAEWKEGIENE